MLFYQRYRVRLGARDLASSPVIASNSLRDLRKLQVCLLERDFRYFADGKPRPRALPQTDLKANRRRILYNPPGILIPISGLVPLQRLPLSRPQLPLRKESGWPL